MKRGFAILLMWLLTLPPLAAQSAFQVQTGIGIPELLHGGATYYQQQHGIGFTVGTLPDEYSQLMSLSTFYQYHFGQSGKLNPMPNWYFQLGASYLADYNERRVITDLFLSPRFGRDVMVSPNSGISLNVGFYLKAFHNKRNLDVHSNSNGFDLDLHFPILPNAGLTVFYRL